MKKVRVEAVLALPADVVSATIVAAVADALERLPGKIEKLNCKAEKD